MTVVSYLKYGTISTVIICYGYCTRIMGFVHHNGESQYFYVEAGFINRWPAGR
jgi:hypothetical protein